MLHIPGIERPPKVAGILIDGKILLLELRSGHSQRESN